MPEMTHTTGGGLTSGTLASEASYGTLDSEASGGLASDAASDGLASETSKRLASESPPVASPAASSARVSETSPSDSADESPRASLRPLSDPKLEKASGERASKTVPPPPPPSTSSSRWLPDAHAARRHALVPRAALTQACAHFDLFKELTPLRP
jgi:hypothetical protein